MNSNFYNQNEDFRYPEIAICMEDTVGPMAKIFIPIATPTLSKNLYYDTKGLALTKNNIVSDSDWLRAKPCTESNYIEMRLPDNNGAKKGDKFIIVFIGGNVNNGVLIGRYTK